MNRDLPPDDPSSTHGSALTPEQARARDRAIASMVSASVLAVMGTLIFAWALRTPDYPWLFAVGALPWLVGVALFGRALWRFTRER